MNFSPQKKIKFFFPIWYIQLLFTVTWGHEFKNHNKHTVSTIFSPKGIKEVFKVPVQSELGVKLATVDKTAIIDALNDAIDKIKALKVVNLTEEERSSTPSIDVMRKPYVDQVLTGFVDTHPQFISADFDMVTVLKDYENGNDMREILTLVSILAEVVSDMGINAEALTYQFFTDFYGNAQKGQTRNVAGANVVVNAIKPLFEDQGGSGGSSSGSTETPI